MNAFWRDYDRSAVTVQEAVGEWSLVAWDLLEETAARWRRTVSEDRLAVEVQKRSGIMTSLPQETWLGPVLSLLAQRAAEEHGAQLTCLVVDAPGSVHPSYREVLALEGRADATADELRRYALEARMVAYRAYGAKIPAGADLVAEAEPRRVGRRAGRTVPRAPVVTICPRCWIQLPPSGHCDGCD